MPFMSKEGCHQEKATHHERPQSTLPRWYWFTTTERFKLLLDKTSAQNQNPKYQT